MKHALLALTLFASAPALADFTGAYNVSNWTETLNGGSIVLTAEPRLIVLISSENQDEFQATDFTITAPEAGLISFDWGYLNGDINGSFFDPFGYLVNGQFFQLTVDGEFSVQSGSASFQVASGDEFGFRMFSTDSQLGASYASVRNFNAAPVPEPETYAMMLAGLALVGRFARGRHTG